MEDMDEVRKASGTVADFSGWNVNNRFGKMKVSSSEKVIEPETEPQQMPEGYINKTQQRKERQEFQTPEVVERSREQNPEERRQMYEQRQEQAQMQQQEQPQQQKREIPTYSININSLGEIKELAKSLLPTLERVKPEEYNIACELAIEYAMIFETIWGQKIGGQNAARREEPVESVEEADQAVNSGE